MYIYKSELLLCFLKLNIISYLLFIIIFFSLVSCQFQDPYKNHGITFLENRSNKLIVKKSNKNDVIKIIRSTTLKINR